MFRSPDLSPRQLLRDVAVIRYVESTGRPMMWVTRTKLLDARQHLLDVLPGIRTPEQIAKVLKALKEGQEAAASASDRYPSINSTNYKELLYGDPEPHERRPIGS